MEKITERYWRYGQIFETRHSNTPEYLARLLRLGDLIIVGREGSPLEHCIGGLHTRDVRKC